MENPNLYYNSENEIDLRVYIQELLSKWKWIIIPAILIGIAVFSLLSLRPKSYKSTALISVSAPSLNVNFETRIDTSGETGTSNLLNNDLPNIALSDAVVFDLFDQLRDQLPPAIDSYTVLADKLSAATETRSEIVILQGTFEDPELSALIVNTWSALFINEANKFLEGSTETSQTFLKTQLETARAERDSINGEWQEFQARNDIQLLVAEVDSQMQLQESYINRRNSLELLQYDIQGIQTQLSQNPNDENVLSDLALYSLQNRAFGTSGNVQFEISTFESLSSTTLSDRVAQLENLQIAANNQQDELDGRIEALEPTILALQEQITELNIEKSALDTERNIILSTYNTLAKKVAEGEIEQNDTTGKVQVAARAIVPAKAESRGRVTSSALAAIVIGAISVFVILALTWWNDQMQSVETASTDSAVSDYTNGTARLTEHKEQSTGD